MLNKCCNGNPISTFPPYHCFHTLTKLVNRPGVAGAVLQTPQKDSFMIQLLVISSKFPSFCVNTILIKLMRGLEILKLVSPALSNTPHGILRVRLIHNCYSLTLLSFGISVKQPQDYR